MTNKRKSLLFSALGAITLWITLAVISYPPEPTSIHRYPVADIHGNVSGDPYETGRLFTRWQAEGGMENSLENVLAIPWGNSLVVIEGDRSNKDSITLVYIGEIGPDYPLMYATEKVYGPSGIRKGYFNHQWFLAEETLFLRSWKGPDTDFWRTAGWGAVSIMVFTIVYAIATWKSNES